MTLQVAVDKRVIAEFCRRHHVKRLALFGSVLGEGFGPDSDVDVLVEFEKGHVPGLIRLAGVEAELADLMRGHKVDLRTPQDLSRYFRQDVLERAEVVYEV